MKKNNPYITEDEIDLGDFVRTLWREKILILSISIICGLAGYLYGSFQPQEFKTEIKIKNPAPQLFEPYTHIFSHNSNTTNTTNTTVGQFSSDFQLNFLHLDNIESFLEKSREFDNFKGYLKSRNISAKNYFANKINVEKQKDLITQNKYFLVFTKELDGDIFLNNYAEFIKKKTIIELKKNLKLSIENKINIFEHALENAKSINLENPLVRSLTNNNQVVNEPDALFYKGSKILTQQVFYLKKLLVKLENEQFNFEITAGKPLKYSFGVISKFVYFAAGLIIGLFLSFGIIFFKGILKKY